MAMTAQAQNYVSDVIDFALRAILFKYEIDELIQRFQLNALNAQLTDQNLAEISGFAHLTNNEVALMQAALTDLKATFEANVNQHLNTLYLFKP